MFYSDLQKKKPHKNSQSTMNSKKEHKASMSILTFSGKYFTQKRMDT